MSLNKHAKRVDRNQPEIVKKLRQLGFDVYLTHKLGKGFPDFIIGFMNINYLVELKYQNGKLTEDEIKFSDKWQGQVNIHYTLEDILNGLLRYICFLDGFKITNKQILLTKILKEHCNENINK